jgi:hypothetical protein
MPAPPIKGGVKTYRNDAGIGAYWGVNLRWYGWGWYHCGRVCTGLGKPEFIMIVTGR